MILVGAKGGLNHIEVGMTVPEWFGIIDIDTGEPLGRAVHNGVYRFKSDPTNDDYDKYVAVEDGVIVAILDRDYTRKDWNGRTILNQLIGVTGVPGVPRP